jgi:segregation and condensation protein B
MNTELLKKIEALLFYLAEPVSVSSLAKTLEVTKGEIEDGIEELSKTLENRGVCIVRTGDEVVLTTAPEMAGTIEKMIKEERERDLGRAGIETLSIIAYKGPVTKKEIEYIRGVNSQYALRSLLLRGLVEKKNSTTDERVVVYNITLETLRFLGIKSVNDLPEYEQMQKQLEVIEEEENTENIDDGE